MPYAVKPEPEWSEGKLNRGKQEDNFDDNASSPGELIVVREDNLTDVERAQIENQFSQKEKSQQQHSRGEIAAQKQQSSESKDSHASSAIYASSNGQIDAPRSSPYQAWESPYAGTSTPTSEAQNDSGPDDRTFPQQVCTPITFCTFKTLGTMVNNEVSLICKINMK